MTGVSRAVKLRAYAATGVLTLLLAGVGWKAWGLQVESAERFRKRAERQHLRTMSIPAPRGQILDARGRTLAVSADAESVVANPKAVVDVVATASQLADILDLDAAALEARLASDKGFVWIERLVSPEEAAAVRAADLPGVDLTTEPRRWYPGGAAGGPVIGMAGVDGKGIDGIELMYDEVLTGTQASFAAVRDARGKTALADGVEQAVPGATVQLTIDLAIQEIADRAIAAAVKQHEAKAGVVVVVDVRNGEILAMSSAPTYDPNQPGDPSRTGARIRAVTDTYEIGSVMKIFTLAAAFDAKITTPEEWWDTEHGVWEYATKAITDTHRDWSLTTAGCFKRSSNVCVAKMALRLGKERFDEALRRFGFGKKTGVELPLEEPGKLKQARRWRDIELATIAYGYAMTVTPVQVAAALAALGDDGRWHTPHLIKRVVDPQGNVIAEPKVETRRIFQKRTVRWMHPILESVFERGKRDGGTAQNVVVDGFRAGGKTGTSHKVDPATKKYSDTLYLGSFAGIAPMDDPRIAVVVVIDEPMGDEHVGGKVAGPVFATVVSETLRYLGVSGSTPINAPKRGGVDDGDTADERDFLAPVDDDELEPAMPPGDDDVPDFRGMSKARALDVARKAGIEIETVGSGRAIAQEIRGDRTVRVRFADLATGMEIGESARSHEP